jgi:hypothetical protein
MAANPVISPGGNRAHIETTVLDQVKKRKKQNRAPAWGSCQITAKRFVGPRNLQDQLIGRSGLCPLDPIKLNISNERAQDHFLSSWSKSGVFYAKERTTNHDDLFVFLVVVRACASYDSAVYLVCVLCGRCALM